MADDSVTVRRATLRDIPTLVELNVHVHQPHVDAHPDIFRACADRVGIEDYFRSILQDPAHHVLIAELEATPVGYVAAEVRRRPEHVFAKAREGLYLHQISVTPAHRRRGTGSALLRETIRVAKALSLPEVALDTWSFNEDAQRFFEAMGFTVFNVRMWRRNLS